MGVLVANADEARWIKRLSEEDADLMAKADVKATRKITRQMRAVQFQYNTRQYFAFFGLSPIDELPEGLSECPLTPGTFGIAVSATDISPAPRVTGAQIRQLMEAEFAKSDGYEGHELDDVASLFPNALIVEADSNLTYTADIDRVLGAVIAASYIDGPLALSEATLKTFRTLFVEGSEYIPYLNILQGILSISWGGLYVELYRCIEQLYAVPRLLELTREWKAEKALRELADLLEQRLSWRPREDESLVKVIGACNESTIQLVISAFGLDLNPKYASSEAAGRAIYTLRNGLVHFRGSTKIPAVTDQQWDRIAAAMLAVVVDSYDAFGRMFHEGEACNSRQPS